MKEFTAQTQIKLILLCCEGEEPSVSHYLQSYFYFSTFITLILQWVGFKIWETI